MWRIMPIPFIADTNAIINYSIEPFVLILLTFAIIEAANNIIFKTIRDFNTGGAFLLMDTPAIGSL